MSLPAGPVLALAAPAGDGGPSPPPGYAELYRQMWRHAAGARGWLLLAFALLVGSQVAKLGLPWLAAQAIDRLQQGRAGGGLATALPWFGAIVGTLALSWAMHGPGRVLERQVAVRVRRTLTQRLYARLAESPLVWHDRHHPGQLQHRMGQSSNALFDFTQNQFVYLQSSVNLIGPVLALSLLSMMAGAIALAGLAVVAVILYAFDRSPMRLAEDENAAQRRYAAVLLDCLANMSTVLSLGLARSTGRALDRRLAAVDVPLRRSIALNEWKWCAVDLATATLAW